MSFYLSIWKDSVAWVKKDKRQFFLGGWFFFLFFFSKIRHVDAAFQLWSAPHCSACVLCGAAAEETLIRKAGAESVLAVLSNDWGTLTAAARSHLLSLKREPRLESRPSACKTLFPVGDGFHRGSPPSPYASAFFFFFWYAQICCIKLALKKPSCVRRATNVAWMGIRVSRLVLHLVVFSQHELLLISFQQERLLRRVERQQCHRCLANLGDTDWNRACLIDIYLEHKYNHILKINNHWLEMSQLKVVPMEGNSSFIVKVN